MRALTTPPLRPPLDPLCSKIPEPFKCPNLPQKTFRGEGVETKMQHKAIRSNPWHRFIPCLVHLYSLFTFILLVSGNRGEQHFGKPAKARAFGLLAGLESIGQRLNHHDTKRLTIRLHALVRSTYVVQGYSLPRLQPHADFSFLILIQHPFVWD